MQEIKREVTLLLNDIAVLLQAFQKKKIESPLASCHIDIDELIFFWDWYMLWSTALQIGQMKIKLIVWCVVCPLFLNTFKIG
jgi:hypothetical protein